jgi:hypothetical protein
MEFQLFNKEGDVSLFDLAYELNHNRTWEHSSLHNANTQGASNNDITLAWLAAASANHSSLYLQTQQLSESSSAHGSERSALSTTASSAWQPTQPSDASSATEMADSSSSTEMADSSSSAAEMDSSTSFSNSDSRSRSPTLSRTPEPGLNGAAPGPGTAEVSFNVPFTLPSTKTHKTDSIHPISPKIELKLSKRNSRLTSAKIALSRLKSKSVEVGGRAFHRLMLLAKVKNASN